MAPLQYLAMFGHQGKRPLLGRKPGAFFDPDFGIFGGTAKGRKYGNIRIEADRIIPPMASRDHPPVQIQDGQEFPAIEMGHRIPIAGMRKGRDDAQALRLLRALASARVASSSRFSRSISFSSAHSLASNGSLNSSHGVP